MRIAENFHILGSGKNTITCYGAYKWPGNNKTTLKLGRYTTQDTAYFRVSSAKKHWNTMTAPQQPHQQQLMLAE